MDLTQLEMFNAVAEAGSITQAAAKVHRVPSNLTTRLRQLETELGVDLFIRENQRLRLSPAGHNFLRYSQQILALVETGSGSLRSSLRSCQTTLKRRCFWPPLMRHARSPMATILRVRVKTAFCLNLSVKQPICTVQAKWRMSVWPAAPGDCLLVTSTIG